MNSVNLTFEDKDKPSNNTDDYDIKIEALNMLIV